MGTNTGTIMTIANSIIGVSVLAMPFCFKECGIVLSILLLIMSSIISRLTCYLLLKSAVMARRRNFEFLAFHIFGTTGKFVAELCIIGFLMGTCIAFFVVVGDLGPAIISKVLNIGNPTALRPGVLIGLAVLVVLPLGLLRNVDSLSSICTATIGFYICLVCKVVLEALPHLMSGIWMEKVVFWRPEGVLQCLPIFSMALFCQTQLFEIYDSLPNPSLERMNAAVRAAINLCTGVYVAVGFFGYIAFCTQTFGGNILMSFAPTVMSDVFKLGFVLSVAVSFPLVIFPCRASLYSLLFRRSQNPHHEMVASFIPETRFKCITVFIISVSLAIGLVIPNIELVLGLVGSTIGVGICVIFPALAFIFVSTKETAERIVAQFLLFVGILILVLGSYANLYAANESVKQVTVLPTAIVKLPVVESLIKVPQVVSELNVVKEAVRQEPPVPMEPVEVKKPALPVVPAESEEKKKPVVQAVETVQVKKKEEVIDKDALKKEDEELADAEKQAVADTNQKNEELLRKLEKHQEEQKKLLQEQKEILQELKEQKIEDAKEKEEKVVAKEKEAPVIENKLAQVVNKEEVDKVEQIKIKYINEQQDTRKILINELNIDDKKVVPEVIVKQDDIDQKVDRKVKKQFSVDENEAIQKRNLPLNDAPIKSSKEPLAYQQRYLNSGENKPVAKNMTVKTLIMPPAIAAKSSTLGSVQAAEEVVAKEIVKDDRSDFNKEVNKIQSLDILKQNVLNSVVDDAKAMRRDILGTDEHDREKREAEGKNAEILKLNKMSEKTLDGNVIKLEDGMVNKTEAKELGSDNVEVVEKSMINDVRPQDDDNIVKTADITMLGEVNELQGKKEENCAKPGENKVDGNQSEAMDSEIVKMASRLTDPVVESEKVEVVDMKMDGVDEVKPMSRDLKSVGGENKTDGGQKSR